MQAVHSNGGPGKGENGKGAGHGGQGGKGTAQSANSTSLGGGMFYGDVVTPAVAGSNGIFSDFITNVEKIGGGILKFDVSTTANIDGKWLHVN